MMNSTRKRRSKLGCSTCRRRKVRCDEQHPICSACCRLHLSCSYPNFQVHERPALRLSQSSAGFTSSSTYDRQRLRLDESSLNQPIASPSQLQSPTVLAERTTGDRSALTPELLSHHSDHESPQENQDGFTDGRLSDINFADLQSNRQFSVLSSDVNIALTSSNQRARVVDANIPLTNGSTQFEVSGSESSLYSNVGPFTLSHNDREPLQHFLTTMIHYCVLGNSLHNDLYSHILTSMGFYHESLFNAMMAWSSLHLAHLKDRPIKEAEDRYIEASRQLDHQISQGVKLDVVLATIWFLLQYDLLLAESVVRFRDNLNRAADILKAELQPDYEDAEKNIGPIGVIILVWMSARDSQAAHFGGAGRLLGFLKTYPHVYRLIDKATLSEDISATIHWATASKSKGSESSHLQACLRLSFRIQTVMGQSILLGRWRLVESDSAAWSSVFTSLRVLQREIEESTIPTAAEALAVAKGSLSSVPTVSPLAYNRLLLLASYYGAVITSQLHKPDNLVGIDTGPTSSLSVNECANRIIRIAQRVNKNLANSPRSFWPTLLFLAAINTEDPIYQSWAIRTFERAEMWGKNLIKARELLEHIIERQNLSGCKLDVVKAMEKETGFFII